MEPGKAVQPLTQLRRGVLEFCVLAVVQREREAYAVDLVRQLSEAGLVISEGTAYPLLSRLRRTGLLATRWSESRSGPPRRYYALTRDGAAALSAFREDWRDFRESVEDLLKESA